MKNFLFLFFVISTLSYAQVGINEINPKATLQVNGNPDNTSVTDGLIMPKISRTKLMAKKNEAYTNEQKGALVYVDDVSGVAPLSNSKEKNIKEVGYYFFDGIEWQKINTSTNLFEKNASNSLIQLNSTSTGSDRAVGTNFVVKDDGNVGVKTNAPEQALDVNGKVIIRTLDEVKSNDFTSLVRDDKGIVAQTSSSNLLYGAGGYYTKSNPNGQWKNIQYGGKSTKLDFVGRGARDSSDFFFSIFIDRNGITLLQKSDNLTKIEFPRSNEIKVTVGTEIYELIITPDNANGTAEINLKQVTTPTYWIQGVFVSLPWS